MSKRLNIFCILFIVSLASLVYADPGYFCVIENDTISVNNEKALESTIDNYIVSLGDQGYPHIEAILNAYVKKGENEYFHYRVDKGIKTMIDTSFSVIILRERYLCFRVILPYRSLEYLTIHKFEI